MISSTSAVQIRELELEEYVETVFALGNYAFHPSPQADEPADRKDFIRRRKGARAFGAITPAGIQSVAVTTPMTQNLRGRLHPAGGVWGVATHPAARRQGFCRASMALLLQSVREAGEAFSNLYPFRESFYARLGYVAWPQPVRASFDPAPLADLLKQDLPGEVERHSMLDVLDEYRNYLFEHRRRTHGMTIFNDVDPEMFRKRPVWVALARREGRVTGAMPYSLQGEQITQFTLRTNRFFYDTPLDRTLLLQWAARHLDQASRVDLALAPGEHPETWHSDLKFNLEPFFVVPMNRIVDVARLEGLPAGTGAFSARIQDPLCPWNNAAWTFHGEGGALHVRPAASSDFSLSIQALSTLVAGVNDPAEFALRGWGDPPVDAQQHMRQLFPPALPYMQEMF